MTYAVLLSMLIVGVAAAGAASLTGDSDEDPYLALEETATPITYGDEAEAAAVTGETVPDTEAPDEETIDAYETVEETLASAGVTEDLEAAVEADGAGETGIEAAAEGTDDPEVAVDAAGDVGVAEASAEADDSGEGENAADANGEDAATADSENGAAEESGDGTVDVSTSDVLSFSEADSLSWPVEGEVLREFSMDTTVYYSTLDAYKVSPSILIQGEPEETVYAAADGIVTEIGTDEEIGNYVVMDLGGNYELTYGQLEEITVSESQLVDAGDAIAVLAEPTKYYSLEGCNLYFMLTQDGVAVDPLDYLQ
ncbi:MAG: peptidoglycan DD-metalloendopeptidase family protein [Lachnospiraceae bacterium]|nr:peptidoglycan DD-metalloendopeptidase family protein [Lachnospiraceae bacterium]